jgi:hypothetical protein
VKAADTPDKNPGILKKRKIHQCLGWLIFYSSNFFLPLLVSPSKKIKVLRQISAVAKCIGLQDPPLLQQSAGIKY